MSTKKSFTLITRLVLLAASMSAMLFATSCTLTDILSAMGLSSLLSSLTSST